MNTRRLRQLLAALEAAHEAHGADLHLLQVPLPELPDMSEEEAQQMLSGLNAWA